MNTILKVAVLSAVLVALASSANAGTITIGSYGTYANNNTTYVESGLANTTLVYQGYTAVLNTTGLYPSTGPSYDVLPAGVWSDPLPGTSWVSNSPNGGPPNGDSADANLGYYYYGTTFMSPYAGSVGTISVLGDDTAEILLNGVVIVNFASLNGDAHCAQGLNGPTCGVGGSVNDVWTVPFTTAAGMNKLEVIDWQSYANSPAGVDFSGSFVTPEPAPLLLLGTGLFGLAMILFRKSKATVRL